MFSGEAPDCCELVLKLLRLVSLPTVLLLERERTFSREIGGEGIAEIFPVCCRFSLFIIGIRCGTLGETGGVRLLLDHCELDENEDWLDADVIVDVPVVLLFIGGVDELWNKCSLP